MGGFGVVPGGTASLADIITGFGEQKGRAATALEQPAAVRAGTEQTELQNQQIRQQLADDQIFRQAAASTDWSNPDPMARTMDLDRRLRQGGMSLRGYTAAMSGMTDLLQKYIKLPEGQLDLLVKEHGEASKAFEGYMNGADPNEWGATRAAMVKVSPDLEQHLPQDAPSAQQMAEIPGYLGMSSHLADLAQKKAQAEQEAAGAAASRANAAKAAAEQANLEAELPGKQAESKLKQAKADRWAQIQKDPTSLDTQIDGEIDPQKYPRENARAKLAAHAASDYDEAQKAIKDSADRVGREEAAVAQAKATQPIKIETAVATQNAAANAAAAGGGLELMAQQALNGTFTSRNPMLVAKVYQRASELAKEMGLSSQQVVMEQKAAKANTEALNSVTKQYETLKPFAEMAEKNADILEQKMKEVSDLGAPVLNTPVRSMQQKFGSAKVSALIAAIQPVQADFARILNSPTAAGQLTDESRHEIQGALSVGATVGQIKAALDVFRTDAKNRKAAYDEALANLKGKTVVGGANAGGAAAAPITYKRTATDPKTGHRVGSNDDWKTVFDLQTGKQVQ